MSAADVVEDLFIRPPRTDQELERRLRGADPGAVRRELVDCLLAMTPVSSVPAHPQAPSARALPSPTHPARPRALRLDAGIDPRPDHPHPPASGPKPQAPVEPQVLEMLSAALLRVGVRGEEARLERIVTDARRAPALRWVALSLIFSLDRSHADRILMALAPDDRLPLILQPAFESIRAVVGEPREADALADALMATHPEVRGEAFAHVERVRRSAGTPAVLAYREVLRRHDLSDVRDFALEVIVREGGSEAAADLTLLRDAAGDAGARQALQRALLRLGTRTIEAASASVPPGTAYLGHCDGQGAFVVLGCFENADGTRSIADVCMRAGADLRDGFADSALDEPAVEAFLDKMRESGVGHFVPISLAEAAAIAREGAQRTRREGLTISDSTRSALLLFERVPTSAPPTPPDRRAPAKLALPLGPAANDDGAPPRSPVTLDEARSLLALPEYDCWFFDRGDLAGAGVPSPPGDDGRAPRGGRGKARQRRGTAGAAGVEAPSPRVAWIDEALGKLEGSEVAPRVVAMLDHMARWHLLNDEPERAAICATAAREARGGLRSCALARAMLERSIEALARPGGRTGRVGDPDTREHIRLEFFPDADAPEGRDLAVLDFTEAAIEALEAAVEVLPGSHRPRADELIRGAHAIGTIFARYVIARRKARPGALVQQMSRALGEVTRLDPEEREMAVATVLPALAVFVDEICGRCPVACLARPRADVSDAFFADEHPAFR